MNKLLLRKYRQNSSRKTLFKERLNAAEKFTDEYIVGKYSNMMSATASMFMKLQIRETKKLSKVHRFTLNEKMLSLSLYYKRSPK